jgi:hypothetical protein
MYVCVCVCVIPQNKNDLHGAHYIFTDNDQRDIKLGSSHGLLKKARAVIEQHKKGVNTDKKANKPFFNFLPTYCDIRQTISCIFLL